MKPIGPQFQEVKPLVGAFVLGALVIALGLVFATARAQRWFERVIKFTLELPEDGSFGLSPASGVELLGSSIGSVDDIWIDDKTDRMQARLLVRAEFLRFVRADSRFIIKRRTLGLTGDAFIEITRGTGAVAKANDTFVAEPDSEPTQLLNDLSAEMLPTIKAARVVIENHGALAEQLADPNGALLQALGRLNRLMLAVEEGDGIAGRLVRDASWSQQVDGLLRASRSGVEDLLATAKTLATDVQGLTKRVDGLVATGQTAAERLPGLLDDARRAMASVQVLLDRLAEASAALPELVGVARDEAQSLSGAVTQSRLALAEVERLVLALQDHWLIRGYVPGRPTTLRLAPSELGGGK